MAKNKGAKQPPRKKRGGKKKLGIRQQLIKVGLGVLVLVMLVVAAGLVSFYLFERPQTKLPSKKKPSEPVAVIPPKPKPIPTY